MTISEKITAVSRELFGAEAPDIQPVPAVFPLPADLAATIDHTLLKPDAVIAQIDQLCSEALAYHFASVCVNPSFVAQCADRLRGSGVKVCTVIGFPLGANESVVKAIEAETAVSNGAAEVDMVINIGRLKSHDHEYVRKDILAVVQAAHSRSAIVKVILETALLDEDEKIRGSLLSLGAKADFIKTSTGFAKGGATTGDISLMRAVAGTSMKVKASGGIRTRDDAVAMLTNGADRLGTSAGVAIVTGAGGQGGAY